MGIEKNKFKGTLNLVSGILCTLSTIMQIELENYGIAIVLGILACINLIFAFHKYE